MSRGIRTQWHLADLTATEADPFAATVYSYGLDVDLATSSAPELVAGLKTLLDREARFFNVGLTCDLKDAGQDCRTCPVATLDREQPRSRLCRLGKDQFLIVDRCKELRVESAAGHEEMAARVDDWTELGHLDADLAELLTAVGL